MENGPEESTESTVSMLKDALQAVFRQMLAENMEAVKQGGELLDPDTLKEGVGREVRTALEGIRVPTEELIAEIVRQEAGSAVGIDKTELDDHIRALLKENLGAFEGEALNADTVTAMIQEAVAGRTKELEDRIRTELDSTVAEKPGAFAESEQRFQRIEKDLESFQKDLSTVEDEGEEIQRKLASVFEAQPFREAVESQLKDRLPTEETIAEIARRETEKFVPRDEGGSLSSEQVETLVRESLGEWTGKLEERIKEDFSAVIEEKLIQFVASDLFLNPVNEKLEALGGGLPTGEDLEKRVQEALASAFQGSEFRETVVSLVKEHAGEGQVSLDDLSEPMAAIASKATEKILAREAEGLVRQIKIELGKIRNEMKKSMEKTVAVLKSPEMGKEIREISGKVVEKALEREMAGIRDDMKQIEGKVQSAASVEGLEEKIEEISSRVAEDVSQESLKGFLEELRDRVESGIEGRLNEFMESDKMKDAIGSIAREVVPAGAGGKGGGGVDAAQVHKIVSDEILRRTEEAFADMIPRHVGKFLDDKLPPPEFFEGLVTLAQVRQEIEKRFKGSGSGVSPVRGFGGGGPGDSAIFSSMIGRLLGSDELKEMIDDKFRVINNYIKNELVPKAVKKQLKKEGK